MRALLDTSPLIREHFNSAGVNMLIDEHTRRVRNHNHVLWALMNAALWHRRFIEGAASAR